ncbi:ATP-dependent RNA helicase DED1 [Trichinella patagoniensis]|uniref:RNA helicase n=1 Tax=Trichinella patagoniensis TaxID=990121 RepID=A0A0V1AGR4_9BILA|nr:ATP-dependent RNA helicase DED1 [Trichinella patagoniensis]
MAQRIATSVGVLSLRHQPVNRSLMSIKNFGGDSHLGQAGSGEGKGGGGGGTVRKAGGAFGRLEAAREEEYFYKMQKKQLEELRKTLDEEVAHHEKHIAIHREAIERHRRKIAEIKHEEAQFPDEKNFKFTSVRSLIHNMRLWNNFYCTPKYSILLRSLRSSSTASRNVKVELIGENLPEPVAEFQCMGFHGKIMNNLEKLGFQVPTAVQKYSIPLVLAGRDVMTCAETGSGKTVAFLAPVFHHILSTPNEIYQTRMEKSAVGPTSHIQSFPLALVLAPTRELSRQIFKAAICLGRGTAIHTAILHGGSENYEYQLKNLSFGGHFIVATPGRLNDLLNQGIVDLKNCKYLVLDEADRMLDMGFEPQIREIVEQHQMPKTVDRQTIMFSATFPTSIRHLASSYLKKNHAFLSVGESGTIPASIKQEFIWSNENDKMTTLVNLLNCQAREGLVLIFVETKNEANRLTYFLNNKSGHQAVTVHGNLSQRARERNLDAFSSGQPRLLIATSVAARGLDIPNVGHVINYNLPNNVEEYVHRVGRTGRSGNSGIAISLCNEKDANIFKELGLLLENANQTVPEFFQHHYPSAKSTQRFWKRKGSAAYSARSWNTGWNHERNRYSGFRSFSLLSKNCE